jgi:hypothetical protein
MTGRDLPCPLWTRRTNLVGRLSSAPKSRNNVVFLAFQQIDVETSSDPSSGAPTMRMFGVTHVRCTSSCSPAKGLIHSTGRIQCSGTHN